MTPVRATTAELVALLRDITAHVEEHDSFGGSFEYEVTDEPGVWSVVGAYRIGNSMGQGGMRLIGTVE